MQQPAAPVPRSSFRRTVVLIALFVIIAVLALSLFLHRGSANRAAAALPLSTSTGIVQHTVARYVPLRRHSPLHVYAVRILPILTSSARIFDQAAASAARAPTMNVLGNTCDTYGTKIDQELNQLDGIPRPFPWYFRAGRLYTQISAVYHDMLGAITDCQTATTNNDFSAASTAIARMGKSSSRFHRVVSMARAASRGP